MDAGTTYDKGQRFGDQRLKRGVGAGVWATAALFRISLMVAHGIGAGTRVHFGAGLTFYAPLEAMRLELTCPLLPMIDLRSDTVTKPSPEMRRAMAEAVVGDDVFLEDPTLNRLQERAADGVRTERRRSSCRRDRWATSRACMAQTRPGQEVICETNGHVYNYEMGALSAIGGVLPRIVEGEDGILSWERHLESDSPEGLLPAADRADLSREHRQHGRRHGLPDRASPNEICDRAHEQGIHVHLDGARVFNAATYLNEDVADMTRSFDSVQFCLSKGLGAPVGSMIVGTRDFIERCRSIRKMLGGGMRQAGVLAAAGLVALEHGPERLQEDHDNAQVLARRLADIPGITLDPCEGADQHRDLQRQRQRAVVRRVPDEACRAQGAGRAGGRRARADGDAPRRHAQDVETAADAVRSLMTGRPAVSGRAGE